MARIAGVDLPREKRVEIGLTYIYGIGLKTSQKILKETGVDPDTRVKRPATTCSMLRGITKKRNDSCGSLRNIPISC